MKRWATTICSGFLCAALTVAAAGAQGYGQAPSGSYTQSCQNIRVRGDRLSANCTATNGQYVRSSLRLSACGTGDIANYNGQLVCARRGGYGMGNGGAGSSASGWWGSTYPTGSYQDSCRNVHMRGSVLVAECTNPQSAYVRSFLDLNQCHRTDHIANVNGQLRCWYNPNG